MREDVKEQGAQIERLGKRTGDFQQPMILQTDAIQLVLLQDMGADAPHAFVTDQMRQRVIAYLFGTQIAKRFHLVANALAFASGEDIKAPHESLGSAPRLLNDREMFDIKRPPHPVLIIPLARSEPIMASRRRSRSPEGPLAPRAGAQSERPWT